MANHSSAAARRHLSPCSMRIVFSHDDLDVAWLARLALRLEPTERRHLVRLAECLLLESDRETLELPDGGLAAVVSNGQGA